MKEIQGSFNSARVFASIIDPIAEGQIKALCDMAAYKDSKIRIMPDVHAGKGCTIGTTMTVTDKVTPGMVGVDIGCGMHTLRLRETSLDLPKLDSLIRKEIPSGREIREKPHRFAAEIALEELVCKDEINLCRAERSIGTLGGGNHFIEVDRDEEGYLYLVIHSGSRHLGSEVADYYQSLAYAEHAGNARWQIDAMIAEYRATGREKEISGRIKEMKKLECATLTRQNAYLEGKSFGDYIHDMRIVQDFADASRRAMADVIVRGMNLHVEECFTTIHNYIDMETMTLRKGAVSAKAGEKLLIPMNMRDGSLVCIGKGNADWNCSAPHGAGRLMSRSTALHTLSMEEYRSEMKGVFTTCVSRETIDESPMAYKPMESILEAITPTCDILSVIKPVYNFKAGE